jgi:hypothetical protein
MMLFLASAWITAAVIEWSIGENNVSCLKSITIAVAAFALMMGHAKGVSRE